MFSNSLVVKVNCLTDTNRAVPGKMLYLLVVVVPLLGFFLSVRYLSGLRDLPPGPWGLPVLGSLLQLSPTTPYLSLTQLADKYGPIYSLQMGRVLAVVISDVRIIREALGKEELAGRADLYLTHGIMEGHEDGLQTEIKIAQDHRLHRLQTFLMQFKQGLSNFLSTVLSVHTNSAAPVPPMISSVDTHTDRTLKRNPRLCPNTGQDNGREKSALGHRNVVVIRSYSSTPIP
ncbi:hypothetical protein J6590_088780 [Homalodisca vitripennis]|nr:hypothetical protein J6590_088780 [Homalodisca vitripennis]